MRIEPVDPGLMPSRQERRKAERDAAKRAPDQAGAAGAGGAAAALANLNVNVNPVGDWTTQAEDPGVLLETLGIETLRRRAKAGDMEGQFSWGCAVLSAANGGAGTIGALQSLTADVGLALFPIPHTFRVAHIHVSSRSLKRDALMRSPDHW